MTPYKFITFLPKLLSKFYQYIYQVYTAFPLQKFGDKSYIAVPIYIHCPSLIKIGNGFKSEKRVRLEAFSVPEYDGYFNEKILIGNNVHINWNCHIGAINHIQIGDNVLIGSNTLITDHSHGDTSSENLLLPPDERPLYSKGPVIIEQNVWIGECVSILPNVKIGENSIIGANSVVTKNIPANVIAAGNPAKIIRNI